MVFVFYVNWMPKAIPNDIFPSLTGSYAALPYVFLVWTAIGLIWYLLIQVRRPGGPAEQRPVTPLSN